MLPESESKITHRFLQADSRFGKEAIEIWQRECRSRCGKSYVHTKQTILLLLGMIILSCGQGAKDLRPEEANMFCHDYYIKGQYELDEYTFCSIVPIEIQYQYKVGVWKFWNLKGHIIAEGVFKLEKKTIEGAGGCDYEMILGEIDRKTWKFWNEEGNIVEPKDELVEQLESCTKNIY